MKYLQLCDAEIVLWQILGDFGHVVRVKNQCKTDCSFWPCVPVKSELSVII
jgi:hypothetical protein